MTSTEERIKELVRARGIEGPDAENLLASVRPAAPPRSKNLFERFSGEVTSAAGVAIAIAAIGVSRLNVRFDGALDMHVTKTPVSLFVALCDQLVALPLTAVVMWIAARLAASTSRVRFIDVFGFVGAARFLNVLLAPPIALLNPHIPHDAAAKPTAALWFMIVLAITMVAVHIVLLVQGFAATSRARGGRLATFFVIGLLVAEVASKVLLGVLT
jgi:hypothetical protein